MKLTVLADNNTYIDRYYYGEPAVSYFLEEDGRSFLFDVGYSSLYRENAKQLGFQLTSVEGIILSHGHNDHTGGLAFFPAVEQKPWLLAHPNVFEAKRDAFLSVGCPLNAAEAEKRFRLQLSSQPQWISPRLLYLGEIERTFPFENQHPIGQRLIRDTWRPDLLLDDTALAYCGRDGLYIITGCSHSGICNIIQQAKRLTGIQRLCGVIGGFHLMDGSSEQLTSTISYLQQQEPAVLYPCHCTCFAARAAMSRVLPVQEVGIGLSVEWKAEHKEEKT